MGEREEVILDALCNLCGGSDAEIVGLRDRHGKPLRTVLCGDCGLVFSDPRPSEQTLRNYYRDSYRLEYKGFTLPGPAKMYKSTLGARNRVEGLRHLLPTSGRLLDIGSGVGEFPYILKSLGYDARGIEPDVACAEFARERLDLQIEARPLENPPPAGAPFAAITMFHVLEHLGDPRSALGLLRSWLSAGGKLIVEVPNVESRATAPHHRFHRAHLFGFNPVTLGALGEANGMRAVEYMIPPDGGTITAVFEHGDSTEASTQLESNADRVRLALEGYTNLQHYLGGTLIRRQLFKLRQSARAWKATRGLSDSVEALRMAAQA